MKNIVIFVFILLFAFLGNSANADHPAELKGPAPTESESGEGDPVPKVPAGPELKESGEALPSPGGPVPDQQIEPIFFGAGAISADGEYLYVILDKFLFQYVLPSLDLKRKVDLDIAVAPVTPSISISKDSKYLYIIYNGILYQIDTETFKTKKRFQIRP